MARIKGTSLLDIVKILRGHKDAARRELPVRLHHYLETRVVLLAWYPEEDFLELGRALVRILPRGGRAPWEWMGRESARHDLADVYRPLLRRGDSLGTLADGHLLWSAYHDSGQFRGVAEGPGSARIELADFALPAAETCELFRGYFAEVLRVSGARAVGGDQDRLPLARRSELPLAGDMGAARTELGRGRGDRGSVPNAALPCAREARPLVHSHTPTAGGAARRAARPGGRLPAGSHPRRPS